MTALLAIGSIHPKPIEHAWVEETWKALAHPSTSILFDRKNMFLVGSTSVNGAGNDIDVVLRCDDLQEVAGRLEDAGWEMVLAEVYRGIASDGWFSARKGIINLLVSEEPVALLWAAGDRVCKAYRTLVGRPTTRDERVVLHQAVFND